MPIDAVAVEEIVEFLIGLDAEDSADLQVLFDLQCSSEDTTQELAQRLQAAGFNCDVELNSRGWRCVAKTRYTSDVPLIERNCRRLNMLMENFDCEYEGFRIAASDSDGANVRIIYDKKRELCCDDDDQIARELAVILETCPSLARICDFERAMQHFRAGRFEDAYNGLWKLCDEDPSEQQCCLPVLGTCRLHQHRYEDAAHLFEHALALLEGDESEITVRLETLVNLGVTYRKLGRIDRAIECLNQAIQTDFFCDSAHFQLACFHSSQGDVDSSLRHLREAILGDLNYVERARTDDELTAIRSSPEFRALVMRS